MKQPPYNQELGYLLLTFGILMPVQATQPSYAKDQAKAWQAALDSQQPQTLFTNRVRPETAWEAYQRLHLEPVLDREEQDDAKDDEKYDEAEEKMEHIESSSSLAQQHYDKEDSINERYATLDNVSQEVTNRSTWQPVSLSAAMCPLIPYNANDYLKKGHQYKAKHHYDEAQNNYHKALLLDASLREAETSLKNIQEELTESIANFPNQQTARTYRKKGNLYLDLGAHHSAIVNFTNALELNEDLFEAYNDRGFAYLVCKVYEKAIADFTLAITKRQAVHQETPNSYNHRGVAYMALGNISEAIQNFQQALAIVPSFYKAHTNLAHAQIDFTQHSAHLFQSSTGNDAKKLRLHIAYLDKKLRNAHAGKPQDNIVKQWQHLIKTCQQESKWSSALALTQRLQSVAIAKKFPPLIDWTHYTLGCIYSKLGDDTQAEKAYNKLLGKEAQWDIKACLALAHLAVQKENTKPLTAFLKKLQSYAQLLDEKAKHVLRRLKIRLCMLQDDLRCAEYRAKKWLDSSEDPEMQCTALELLSQIAQQQHRLPKAIIYQEAYASKMYQCHAYQQSTQAWHQLGRLHITRKQWSEARLALSRAIYALRELPSHVTRALLLHTNPYRDLISVLVAQNCRKEALAVLDQAQSLAFTRDLAKAQAVKVDFQTIQHFAQNTKSNIICYAVLPNLTTEQWHAWVINSHGELYYKKLGKRKKIGHMQAFVAQLRAVVTHLHEWIREVKNALEIQGIDKHQYRKYVSNYQEHERHMLEGPEKSSIQNRLHQLRELINRKASSPETEVIPIHNILQCFYKQLVAPLAPFLNASHALTIIPDGPLWQVPFSALADANNIPLIEHYPITLAPSIGVMRDIQQREDKRKPRFAKLIIGNPYMPKMEHTKMGVLPASEKEAKAIGKVWYIDYLKGASASKDCITNTMSNPHNLFTHLASHGEQGGILALAPSQLYKGWSKNEDGLLKLSDIDQLKIHSKLIVLSACQSGLGQDMGQKALQSSAHALLRAGASAVVASLWNVGDEIACTLMTKFHEQLIQRQPIHHALQVAMQSVCADKSYLSPYQWAPFFVLGDIRSFTEQQCEMSYAPIGKNSNLSAKQATGNNRWISWAKQKAIPSPFDKELNNFQQVFNRNRKIFITDNWPELGEENWYHFFIEERLKPILEHAHCQVTLATKVQDPVTAVKAHHASIVLGTPCFFNERIFLKETKNLAHKDQQLLSALEVARKKGKVYQIRLGHTRLQGRLCITRIEDTDNAGKLLRLLQDICSIPEKRFKNLCPQTQLQVSRKETCVKKLTWDPILALDLNGLHHVPELPLQAIIREKVIEKIFTRLTHFVHSPTTKPSLVLSGVGGVGKSTLAMAYAKLAFKQQRYRSVWWFDTATDADFLISLRSTAQKLGIFDHENLPREKLYAQITNNFYPPSPWLIILDNIPPNKAAAKAYLQCLSLRTEGHLLFTTRDSSWDNNLPLSAMQPEEAHSLLYKFTPPKNDKDLDALYKIASMLSYLPLQLVHAGHYINKTAKDKNPYCSYLNQLRRQPDQLRQQQDEQAEARGAQVSLYGQLRISLAEIKKEHPLSIIALQVIPHLHPDQLTINLLSFAPIRRLKRKLKKAFTPKKILGSSEATGIVNKLSNYGILQQQIKSDKTKYYSMHKLTHEVLGKYISRLHNSEHALLATLQLLKSAWKAHPTQANAQFLLSHLPIVIDHAQCDKNSNLLHNALALHSQLTQPNMIREGLDLYLPPQTMNRKDVHQRVMNFITQSTCPLLLLQGDAGVGKSVYAYYLEQALWEMYWDDPYNTALPLLIDLPQSYVQGRPKDLIGSALERIGIQGSIIDEFQENAVEEEQSWIFILDGYDEINGNHNLYTVHKLSEWGADTKVIITCRSTYLQNKNSQALFSVGEKACPNIQIAPFSKENMYAYIEKFASSRYNKHTIHGTQLTAADYQAQIRRMPALQKLLTTPFLLALGLQALPILVDQSKNRDITRTQVHAAFAQAWFKREQEKPHNLGIQKLTKSLDRFCQQLGWVMWCNNKQVMKQEDPNLKSFLKAMLTFKAVLYNVLTKIRTDLFISHSSNILQPNNCYNF